MNILFTTLVSDDLGLLARSLPVAAELAARGHRVAFCNPAPAPARLIAQAGFANLLPRHPFYYLIHLMANDQLTPAGLWKAQRSGEMQRLFGGALPLLGQMLHDMPGRFAIPRDGDIWSMDHLAAMTGMLNERHVRGECQALGELMSEFGADLVVDAMHPAACMAARLRGIRLVTLVQADMHPANRGFLWWREPPAHLPSPAAVINRVLAEGGLAPVRKTEDLFSGDLTLVLGMPETDPLPTISLKGAHYVGGLVWPPPCAPGDCQSSAPDWFARLDPRRPLIWVYSGNPRYLPVRAPVDSEVIIQASIAALSGEPLQVVLTTGYHALPKGTGPLPENFVFAPYAPGQLLAERSDLLIHHGGFGSCQTGLLAGVPALIIPTYSERESNARRLVAAGAGEMLLPEGSRWGRRSLPPEALLARVRHMLSEPTYRANARRLGEKMRAYGGAVEAANLIEGM